MKTNPVYIWLLLQVLYHCPGLRGGIKKLYNLSKRKDKPKEETNKGEEVGALKMKFLYHKMYNSKEWLKETKQVFLLLCSDLLSRFDVTDMKPRFFI